MSTSALLVSTLTETDIYHNIRAMLRSAWVPFLLTCGIYLWAGSTLEGSGGVVDIRSLFQRGFDLSPLCLLPAAAILVLALFRVNVRRTMLASILLAAGLALWVQGIPIPRLPELLLGYRAGDPQLATMMNGGGVVSMLRVSAIVCIASSYAGLFQGTGLLDPIRRGVGALSRRATPFGAMILVSAAASAVACNQSLAAMLTHQMCGDLTQDREELALWMEDTVIVIAPLIPWSIAGAVPLASVGAPTVCIFSACFLYLLSLYRLGVSLWRQRASAQLS